MNDSLQDVDNPYEGPGFLYGEVIVKYSPNEYRDAVEYAVTSLLGGDIPEKALGNVEPGDMGQGEMNLYAEMLF